MAAPAPPDPRPQTFPQLIAHHYAAREGCNLEPATTRANRDGLRTLALAVNRRTNTCVMSHLMKTVAEFLGNIPPDEFDGRAMREIGMKRASCDEAEGTTDCAECWDAMNGAAMTTGRASMTGCGGLR